MGKSKLIKNKNLKPKLKNRMMLKEQQLKTIGITLWVTLTTKLISSSDSKVL
jgi:hypothetical protein